MISCDALLQAAASRQASDIHLSAGLPPVFRVNGDLVRLQNPLTLNEIHFILSELLPDDRQQPYLETGEADFSRTIPGIGRLRINIAVQRGTPAIAIRRIPERPQTLEELALPKSLADLCSSRGGLILVTGPTGSGKTSTLAALVDHINRTQSRHIITLEDPVEVLHEHEQSVVHQREIGTDAPSFAAGIRTALRQDPDVLLVGEMRDLETMTQTLQAADTGHLVMATLHSTNAVATIDRIINVFPAEQQQQVRIQLAATLQAVISQRLFKRTDAEGRVPALEVLVANHSVRNLIREGKTHQIPSYMQSGGQDGMRLMEASVKELYTRQQISYADYQAWTQQLGKTG